MSHLEMNLKVCEGCGGLWIRSQPDAGVYCRHCSVVLGDFPAPRSKRGSGRGRRAATHQGLERGAGSQAAGGAL